MDASSEIERLTMRQVTWRILPFLMLAYLIAFVDRVNVGFAALQMNGDLHLSPEVFGFGGGLFYISYVLFEVPSNLAMERVGARLWIARILVTWGLVSAAMALVVGPYSFYAVRLLLGAAEAGFFPGVILYITTWFPPAYRGRIVALFMVSIPISSFLGSPLSAALLGTDGWLGLRGWQWMFILEAAPAVVLGALTLVLLPDGPARAAWLSPERRAWLTARLAAEAPPPASTGHRPLWRVMTDRRVLAASLIYAGASGASQCLSLWQPQIIKAFGLGTMETGFLNALPFGIASVLMILWGRNSDRAGERLWHTGLPLLLLAGSLVVACLIPQAPTPTIAILCVAVTATYIVKGPFWALSSEWLKGGEAAAGIAQINAIGNIGGFVGSSLLGVIKGATGSYPLGLLPLAVISGIGGVLVFAIGNPAGRTIAGRSDERVAPAP